jgi:lysophospholipase L1-like esterase
VRHVVVVLFVVAALVGCTREPPAYESKYTPTETTTARPAARIAVVGDSYVSASKWTGLAKEKLASSDTPVSEDVRGEGGSGYVKPGSKDGVFADHAKEAIKPGDSLIVFVGSRNDREEDPAAVGAAAANLFGYAKATAPQAKLLVIGPLWPEGNPPSEVLATRDVMREQATSAGATWIDPIAEGWLTGDPALLRDGVHPSAAGDQRLAELIAPLIARQLQP